MNLRDGRILPSDDPDIFMLTCVACGHVGLTLTRSDLPRMPLDWVASKLDHVCRTELVEQLPPTPREGSFLVRSIRAFIEESMVKDPGGVIPLAEIIERQGGAAAWVGSGQFSRALRSALPDCEIRREMINGVRARRLVGMRWK